MSRIGVLLAAGRGRRMGRTKQVVLCKTAEGDVPLVAAAYDAIRPLCDEMIIVLGHEANAVATALAARTFHCACADPDAPMYESIRTGLRAAREMNVHATVVLQPGDHPEVASATLTTLADCALRRPPQAIIPVYSGRGGHPVLIPPSVIAKLIDATCPNGLGEYWLRHPELCCRVPVDDPSVVRDIDIPGDLHAGTPHLLS